MKAAMAIVKNVLCVAEKNDAAKGIATLLSQGRMTRRNGASVYNKLYCFSLNVEGRDRNVVMTSVSGHLFHNDFQPQFGNWSSVRPSELFHAPIRKYVPPNNQPLERSLRTQAAAADLLLIWTDCDREGENIGAEVVQVCRGVNPGIRVLRAKFSEITPAAVQRAIRNLAQMDWRLSEAVDCRSELDLRTGAAFTRLQTLHLQRRFPQELPRGQGPASVVSYGSCQFPTLGFVVERYKRIQEFVPENFWKLEMQHSKNGVKTEFLWGRVRLFQREPCALLLDKCLSPPFVATVGSVETKPKSRWRPLALETVQLEKLAVRKLQMTAKQTMTVAEKLYTKGLISYPRTETNGFPKNLDLAPLVAAQAVDPNWGGFAQQVAQRGPNPRNGHKSDGAHPPIHPTRWANPGEITGEELRLYQFIVRHFLACVSKDAEGKETKVETELGGETFLGTGLIILDRGYLEVYPYDGWRSKAIGNYALGQQFRPDSVEMKEGRTQAPDLLTEADLIALMDKHGIGTDATHAQHIEHIQSRNYIGRRPDGRFLPGFLGLGLVDGYDLMGYQMSRPNLRAEFEADLKRICSGEKTKDQVLQFYIDKYRRIFLETERRVDMLSRALNRYWANNPNPQPP